jgi:TetR/AcrR family transcriptional regulator, transcriptional repressor for nem operon
MDTGIRDRILDAAEARARVGGYHGFSFRDVAEDVGVKSASIHYHFPTKSDLAAALAQRYTARARQFLGDPKTLGAQAAVARVIGLFRDALERDDKMCLCGLFGAERDTLPQPVADATAAFFTMVLDYLAASGAGKSATATLATLEGALILARTLQNNEFFEKAIATR